MSRPQTGARRAAVIPELGIVHAAVSDPTVTGVGREPMRPLLVPYPDAESARTDDREASQWWLSLDGTWDVRFFDSLAAVPASALGGAMTTGLDVDDPRAWQPIEVPGSWTTRRNSEGCRFVEPHYTNVIMPFDAEPPSVPRRNPVGVHRRVVTVPRQWAGRRIVLRVGSAESVLGAYVDGTCVGVGTDSRLPNEFDITDLVRAGRRSTIVLVVVRWSAATWVEDQDQWWHGGIQRSVTLHSTAPTHLAGIKALPGLLAQRESAPSGRETTVGTLDVEVVVDGPARRERGWTVRIVVEPLTTGSSRAIADTGPLDVPVWNQATEGDQLLSAMFVEPGVVRAGLEIPGIKAWSHEKPDRYRVLVTLLDADGQVVEVACLRTGFRSLEVIDNELLINGRPVLIHGVNLHEHDPEHGRFVEKALTRQDLQMMKAHNLNAVRAAHYPHDEHLADLCDELGLYLVDEANVESHGRQASLCNDPRYVATMVERVERMVRRDSHHPSIIMWSLGNESGDGAAQAAAAAWVRHHDPTRPLHYEGPLMHDLYAEAPVTDIVCPMYSSIDDIVAWAASGRDARRPLILCEYSHAMGNSNGSLSDYWSAFESNRGLQGGFIWEWLDHGLPRDPTAATPVGLGPDGRTSWGYGGDFGDVPNDSNFICDGLVSADREAHPAMEEVLHVGRPASVEWADGRRRRLRIMNRRWFSGIEDLRSTWRLRIDGVVADEGPLDVPELGPRRHVDVAVPVRVPLVDPGSEVHLEVVWTSRRKTAWARAGTRVGLDQLVMEPRISTRGGQVDAVPVRPVGIEDLPWRPTLFRALTDNDGLKQGWVSGWLGNYDRWVTRQGLDRCSWEPGSTRRSRSGDLVTEVLAGRLVPGGEDTSPVRVRRRVTARPDGWTHVEVMIDVPADLADPPRVGTEWELPGSLNRVEWFGDGPHETYPDRRAGSFAARHVAAVNSMYTDYVVPQEHGHRTSVRWLAVGPGRTGRSGWRSTGSALLIVADPTVGTGTIGAAVRRHSDAELWAGTHTDDLRGLTTDAGSPTYLYLDVATRGLGTASCGPDALDRYRISAGRHVLSVWIAAFEPRFDDPGELARKLRGSVLS